MFSPFQGELEGVIINNLQTLLNTLPQTGKVIWIGLRPAKKAAMHVLQSVQANTKNGLVGDRYNGRSGNRQVTLIQAEHSPVIASCLGVDVIPLELLRRNIVVSGINLLALKDKAFSIGEAKMEMTGLCHPCSYMEQALGPGGYNAVRGHGGITARVIQDGKISVNDKVSYFSESVDTEMSHIWP